MKTNLLFALTFIVGQSFAQNIEKLYAKLNPTVVTILVKENKLVEASGNTVKTVTAQGLGSGVYVNEEGIIITASHVVKNAESIMVLFSNGEKAPAKVISASVASDVAIIKTIYKPSKNIPVAVLGDSELAKIGEQIIIIGAPYGLEHSLSVGYLSGRHTQKNLISGATKNEFLQTDAAINHGNSGGPMFNLKGEVIGIVSHILSESGGFEGLGFAASINLAKDMMNDKSSVWFGTDAIFLNEKQAKMLNVPSGGGLLVQHVVATSPASVAGIKGGNVIAKIDGKDFILGGDIIIEINGLPLVNEMDLEKVSNSLNETPKGEVIKVKLLRAGKIIELDILKPQ